MRKLWTPRWLLVHAAALILAVGFLLLCWWQVTRATQGNLLSFGYAIEWPAFSAFVVYVWWKEVRQVLHPPARQEPSDEAPGAVDRPETPAVAADAATVTDARVVAQPIAVGAGQARMRRRQARNEAAYDDSGDSELAAYNRYLAWLNANPNATPAEYPG